jgi:hypothetical protein
MYLKPRVDRFGTLRELTLAGFQGGADGMTIRGIAGNNCEAVSENPDGTINFLGCFPENGRS